MKNILKNNLSLVFAIIVGLIISGVSVYAATLISPNRVSYSDSTVEEALDSLYEKANKIGAIKKFCQLKSGEAETIGAEYECDPGDGIKRTFYVLTVRNNEVDLIMDRNITQGTSKTTMTWNDAMKYFSDGEGVIYKNSWINVMNIDLPKAQDIANAVGNNSWKVADNEGTWWCLGSKKKETCDAETNKKYAWLYNYTGECISAGCDASTSLGSTEAYGYWTRDLRINSVASAWVVSYAGDLGYHALSSTYDGIRPVITVLKQNLYE